MFKKQKTKNPSTALESPGELVNTHNPEPSPRDSGSAGVGWGN